MWGSYYNSWVLLLLLWFNIVVGVHQNHAVTAKQHQILVDTDVDTDDFFALLYLLKLNRSVFDLKAVTINTNAWTNAGHAVNHMYDMLFMMGRDDILVGVGGEGGISRDGDIFPDVGGYLPIIEQVRYCRYRQAIPLGQGGRLDTDTNYGLRKDFLPQGKRKYLPLLQPTSQQVMIDVVSKGPTTVFLMGAHTNFALFLMRNPLLKKNVEHIYIMGGGVRSNGNVFSDYTSNPYAEFNIFGDPFSAYQVIHSGIPITLVPLDATNTIPITKQFFEIFEKNQKTYEAQYIFKSLKLVRDTWFNDQFYSSYFMWDSFMAGVAVSIMSNPHNNPSAENEFAEMEYMNITVRTSNKPYGILDGSNPFFNGRKTPKFHLKKNGVHSGHVQKSLRDPFCLVKNQKGRCKDAYTEEISGPEGVRVLVATRAKPNKDPTSPIDRQFFKDFLDVLNHPHQSGRFNFTTQFSHYKEVLYRPDFRRKKLGKPVILDMDMSAGDFIALFYLLKVPVEVINLEAIFITPTGWANAATIDIVYDLLHMMGRDDIQVGLGDVFAKNQSDPSLFAVGDCKYIKAIPHGSGGFLDSDTLYGLARGFPRREGNLFTVPSNKYAEFNMFLDPLSAKMVIESKLPITLIPLEAQKRVRSFRSILDNLSRTKKTPEERFTHRLISKLHSLHKERGRYQHVDMFLGEILGAVILSDGHSSVINSSFQVKHIRVLAAGREDIDGQMVEDVENGLPIKTLKSFDEIAYYDLFAKRIGDKKQSAVVGSFSQQKRMWSRRRRLSEI
ncbi:hypothetical protein BVRB_8g192710 [Beta vulgaris subsp. vulgaris]|nr:hypothetical protein BVRB_8g192710 [Beta vulgaris subsp. vulgaris]